MVHVSGGPVDAGPVAHPLLQAARVIEAELDAIKGIDPGWMPTAEKAAALLAFDQLADRLAAARLRILHAAQDVADEAGARRPADLLAAQSRRDRRAVLADEHLAGALERWALVGAGVVEGSVNLGQARVIIGALEVLPARLVGEQVLADAEAYLVGKAAEFGPEGLRRLGQRLLEVVAPEQLEEAERLKLEAELERARSRPRLRLRPHHDGTTTLTATLPDAAAERLKLYLDAIASPRVNPDEAADEDAGGGVGYATVDPATGRRIPADEVRGQAFCALLEHLDPAALPDHGGLATQVIVTIDLETLRSGLGSAGLFSGGAITAAEARRLACSNGVIPAVLGGASEVLDLGRSRRLFSGPQRKALTLMHRRCQAEGCSVPAAQAEFHHGGDPWSAGGRTDLAEGMVLCAWHHHRIHDPAYESSRSPGGEVRFHRRP